MFSLFSVCASYANAKATRKYKQGPDLIYLRRLLEQLEGGHIGFEFWGNENLYRLMVITGAHVISHWCCSCEPCGPLGLPWNMIRRVAQGWYYTKVEVVSLVGLWAFHQIWSKEWGQWLLESLIILGIIWVMSRDSWLLILELWLWVMNYESWIMIHYS